jgi:3-oxoacyl-[acyl-carrier protein] reductase
MDELPEIGKTSTLSVAVTADLIDRFADFSGDRNPLHLDDGYASLRGFPRRVAHGMSYAAFVSTLIGMDVPGPGALWNSLAVRFLAPVYPDDTLAISATVSARDPRARRLRLTIAALNQNDLRVMEGECEVVLPRHGDVARPPPSAATAARDEPAAPPRPVALLAGASGDLGRAIAAVLGRQGYAIGLAGRNSARLDELVAELGGVGTRGYALEMDLRDEGSVAAAVRRLEAAVAPVDLVVHCASAALNGQELRSVTPAELMTQADVQAGGLLRLLRACGDGMIRRGRGGFVFVGSTAARGVPPKGLGAYASAKSAAVSLVKSIAAEYGPAGIRANVVSPYFLETKLQAHASEKVRRLAAAQVPLRRLAQLKEIADAVGFLASGNSSYVNGHDLIVDGGHTMA